MRLPTVVGLVVLLSACPRGAPPRGTAGLDLVVLNRIPLQCTPVVKDERDPEPTVRDATGCNATVRFRMLPSGHRDVDLPFFRDAVRAESVASAVTEGTVAERTLVVRDPGGERLWSAQISDSQLPWSERCPRPDDLTRFDVNPWRFLVVRVQTLDALGTTRPLAEAQPDTLGLRLRDATGGEPVRPVVVPSPTHPGVWLAAWCGDAPRGPYELELDVRGAYQLEADRFRMPDASRDTVTFLDYTVTPPGAAAD